METVVIDANFGVALVRPMPYSPACRSLMEAWIRRGIHIEVPALWDYEVVSALRKQWVQNLLSRETVLGGLEQILRLPVQRIIAEQDLVVSALLWAEQLGQIVAYDAQYLALTERQKARFYTADHKLYNRCKEIGVDFINLLE